MATEPKLLTVQSTLVDIRHYGVIRIDHGHVSVGLTIFTPSGAQTVILEQSQLEALQKALQRPGST